MKARAALTLLALCAALGPGCRKDETAPPLRAEFGVFFGGQVQERDELELTRGSARNVHGIRVDFREAPSRALEVTWEITKPDPSSKSGTGTLVEYGKVSSRPGETRLDIPLAWKPSDRTGNWHVKASVEGAVVIDRDFRVVAPPTTKPRNDED
jgi:hypothetical protein